LDLSATRPAADFKIGELATVTREGTRNAVDVAAAFMAGLAAGRLREENIAPDRRALLAAGFSDLAVVESGTEGRLGVVLYEGGTARARVRLLGDRASTEGDIYLDLVDGSWVVTDVQIDLGDLQQPSEEQGPFFPSTYSGVLQGY
jgi:hypothetical protein